MKANTFRTEITCPSARPIGLRDCILTTGSCFADQFGQWMKNNKFDLLVNPFGTTYNPISIHKNLLDSLTLSFDEQLFVDRSGIWYHFNFNSKWWGTEKQALKTSIHHIQQQVFQRINKMNVLIITYGTAWVYHHKKQNCIVANCHKIPATEFEKQLLRVEDITASFGELYTSLQKLRPGVRIIVTVSPVRHMKDTLVLNSVSKASLRLACHALTNQFENVEYFPSYEIMMDDLRDYRFYDRDKIHPTEEALDYISGKFSDQYFNLEAKKFIERWSAIRQAMEHKPYQPNSEVHQHFLKELVQKLEELKDTVSVAEEINIIQSQIHSNA